MGKKYESVDPKGRQALLALEENRKATIYEGLKSAIPGDQIDQIIQGATQDVDMTGGSGK